jgi:hypothetical protein
MNREIAELVRAALRGTVDVQVSPTGLTPLRLSARAISTARSDADAARGADRRIGAST